MTQAALLPVGPPRTLETPLADSALEIVGDAALGALFVGVMGIDHPTAENFASLGRILRAASREDLELALRRRAR